jgi:hypothetical protein
MANLLDGCRTALPDSAPGVLRGIEALNCAPAPGEAWVDLESLRLVNAP